MDPDVVFEVSWEICNKVGGIYTVISSKAARAVEKFDKYFCIGPYKHEKVIGEFQDQACPEEFKDIFEEMQEIGVTCHFGKWLIDGEPNVILLDTENLWSALNDFKRDLWDQFQIDSLKTGNDVDEPMVFSHAVGMLLEKLSKKLEGKCVAQFHEWLTGGSLLYLKARQADIGTVFTTHATILGRTIASSGDLYENLDKIEPIEAAYNHGIQTKYLLERHAAQNADVFTTVSAITGMEAEKLLERKPDVLLPNGLDIDKFPSFEESSIEHSELKFRIKEYIIYHFFPYQEFDLDETYIFFTFARYEFHNKGIDVMIEALSKLNEKMKEEKSERTIVSFFFVPREVRGIKTNIVENKTFYQDIRESIDSNIDKIRNRLILLNTRNAEIKKCEEILSKDLLAELKKKRLRFVKKGKPPLSSHDLTGEEQDAILNHLKHYNLLNKDDDKVKVVFYPIYLTGADGLLDLDYYETITGGHLGIFPSVYEPWGYTPLEAGALGVSSITSDLAGFGQYVGKQRPKKVCNAERCDVTEEKGIYVARRQQKDHQFIVDELFNIMHHYANLSKKDRIDNKIEARRLAALADWKNLYSNYIKAYSEAVKKKWES